ncbi:MAG: glycosyltransferase, partial [Candidatus Omnitrophota bacterium]|nr:glycosyltransferase [Candidatus Omnitrophota bacterium]
MLESISSQIESLRASGKRFSVSVFAKNRIGLTYDITTIIAGLGINIIELLSPPKEEEYVGYEFILQAPSSISKEDIKKALEATGEATVEVQKLDNITESRGMPNNQSLSRFIVKDPQRESYLGILRVKYDLETGKAVPVGNPIAEQQKAVEFLVENYNDLREQLRQIGYARLTGIVEIEFTSNINRLGQVDHKQNLIQLHWANIIRAPPLIAKITLLEEILHYFLPGQDDLVHKIIYVDLLPASQEYIAVLWEGEKQGISLPIPATAYAGIYLAAGKSHLAIKEINYDARFIDIGDSTIEAILAVLDEYAKIHNLKIAGAALAGNEKEELERIGSRLWLEQDTIWEIHPAGAGYRREILRNLIKNASNMFEDKEGVMDIPKVYVNPETGEVMVRRLVNLEDYKNTVEPVTWELLLKLADAFRGKKLISISSTPQGGGVALMRHRLIDLLRLLGIDARWYILAGDDKVFEVTKEKIHNVLQGVSSLELAESDKSLLGKWWQDNFNRIKGVAQDADVIIIDDYQPSGLIEYIKKINPKAKFIYRSHIQIQSDLIKDPTKPQRNTWKFIWRKEISSLVDLFVAHPIISFVPFGNDGVAWERLLHMPAASDPLDGLNKPLTEEQMYYYLRIFNQALKLNNERLLGIKDEELEIIRKVMKYYPRFSSLWEKEGARGALESLAQKPLDLTRPYIIQVARFDPAKGIPFVLSSYKLLRGLLKAKGLSDAQIPQLVIVGHGAVDDPEGLTLFYDTLIKAFENEGDMFGDIKIARLPHNDQVLNALARKSKVGLQLSTAEGFEIKVSELLLKGIPMVVFRTGGIPLQIKDGVNGYVVQDHVARDVAARLYDLFTDVELYKTMSGNAKKYARRDVWTVPNTINWLFLAVTLSDQELLNKLIAENKTLEWEEKSVLGLAGQYNAFVPSRSGNIGSIISGGAITVTGNPLTTEQKVIIRNIIESNPTQGSEITLGDAIIRVLDALRETDYFLIAYADPVSGRIYISPSRWFFVYSLPPEAQQQVWAHEVGHLKHPDWDEARVSKEYPINLVLNFISILKVADEPSLRATEGSEAISETASSLPLLAMTRLLRFTTPEELTALYRVREAARSFRCDSPEFYSAGMELVRYMLALGRLADAKERFQYFREIYETRKFDFDSDGNYRQRFSELEEEINALTDLAKIYLAQQEYITHYSKDRLAAGRAYLEVGRLHQDVFSNLEEAGVAYLFAYHNFMVEAVDTLDAQRREEAQENFVTAQRYYHHIVSFAFMVDYRGAERFEARLNDLMGKQGFSKYIWPNNDEGEFEFNLQNFLRALPMVLTEEIIESMLSEGEFNAENFRLAILRNKFDKCYESEVSFPASYSFTLHDLLSDVVTLLLNQTKGEVIGNSIWMILRLDVPGVKKGTLISLRIVEEGAEFIAGFAATSAELKERYRLDVYLGQAGERAYASAKSAYIPCIGSGQTPRLGPGTPHVEQDPSSPVLSTTDTYEVVEKFFIHRGWKPLPRWAVGIFVSPWYEFQLKWILHPVKFIKAHINKNIWQLILRITGTIFMYTAMAYFLVPALYLFLTAPSFNSLLHIIQSALYGSMAFIGVHFIHNIIFFWAMLILGDDSYSHGEYKRVFTDQQIREFMQWLIGGELQHERQRIVIGFVEGYSEGIFRREGVRILLAKDFFGNFSELLIRQKLRVALAQRSQQEQDKYSRALELVIQQANIILGPQLFKDSSVEVVDLARRYLVDAVVKHSAWLITSSGILSVWEGVVRSMESQVDARQLGDFMNRLYSIAIKELDPGENIRKGMVLDREKMIIIGSKMLSLIPDYNFEPTIYSVLMITPGSSLEEIKKRLQYLLGDGITGETINSLKEIMVKLDGEGINPEIRAKVIMALKYLSFDVNPEICKFARILLEVFEPNFQKGQARIDYAIVIGMASILIAIIGFVFKVEISGVASQIGAWFAVLFHAPPETVIFLPTALIVLIISLFYLARSVKLQGSLIATASSLSANRQPGETAARVVFTLSYLSQLNNVDNVAKEILKNESFLNQTIEELGLKLDSYVLANVKAVRLLPSGTKFVFLVTLGNQNQRECQFILYRLASKYATRYKEAARLMEEDSALDIFPRIGAEEIIDQENAWLSVEYIKPNLVDYYRRHYPNAPDAVRRAVLTAAFKMLNKGLAVEDLNKGHFAVTLNDSGQNIRAVIVDLDFLKPIAHENNIPHHIAVFISLTLFEDGGLEAIQLGSRYLKIEELIVAYARLYSVSYAQFRPTGINPDLARLMAVLGYPELNINKILDITEDCSSLHVNFNILEETLSGMRFDKRLTMRLRKIVSEGSRRNNKDFVNFAERLLDSQEQIAGNPTGLFIIFLGLRVIPLTLLFKIAGLFEGSKWDIWLNRVIIDCFVKEINVKKAPSWMAQDYRAGYLLIKDAQTGGDSKDGKIAQARQHLEIATSNLTIRRHVEYLLDVLKRHPAADELTLLQFEGIAHRIVKEFSGNQNAYGVYKKQLDSVFLKIYPALRNEVLSIKKEKERLRMAMFYAGIANLIDPSHSEALSKIANDLNITLDLTKEVSAEDLLAL